MCAHFIIIPKDELERIVADVMLNLQAEKHGNIAASYQEAFPKSSLPILVPGLEQLEIREMQWGYPVTWQKDVVFNTKIETALSPKRSMWTDSIIHRRCLVPSFGFYEPHMKDTHPSPKTGKPVKDKYFFRLPDNDVLWMAGVFEGEYFSVMTTAPNQWMETIHPRMPVVLRPDELGVWLHGEYTALADRNRIQLESCKAG
jgi:putative SOS response-associated peptidase YedK